jgi:methylase of polypeptide subunit release factors
VRQAVELLVDAFGRADREHGGTLLAGIEPQEIYLAAVTVMMRAVFLLSAEERGLFLLDDPIYDASYAISTLRAQLQEEADRFGEEPLERRSSAWHRILATFRMVYAGVQHENLRLPAYGGSLFDPDRFPFLEGRASDKAWRDEPGRPLPIDDRTVLHILDALQVLRFRLGKGVSEARRLSFRALDVEQIGHVYEGLLDHTAVRVTDPAVGLDGKLEPEIALAELEQRSWGTGASFGEWLAGLTGRTATSIGKSLDGQIEPHRRAQLLAACDNDPELADRVAPFHGLLRDDLRGLPQVYIADSVYVTKAGERRSSGTYYTPRSLAEEMVEHALAPLVYRPGPAEGADPKEWNLRSPTELLELKICDMAMGSGAFLVAATRYVADRLVEAWAAAGPGPITIEGNPATSPDKAILADADDQVILARRLVADRCIYGVDKNPMAVEMAKLSMWLITLAKDRPFAFLDHALKCGDSLLGVHDLAQIEHMHMDPARGRDLHMTLNQHWHVWQAAVNGAIEHRRELESFTVMTVRDAELKERLYTEAEQALEDLRVAADIIVGAALSTARDGKDALDSRLLGVAGDVAAALDPDRKIEDRRVLLENLRSDASYWLNEGRPAMQQDRYPFHWPLEFPEVFANRSGFDGILGNPPFLGGTKISRPHGDDYRQYLAVHLGGMATGRADLVAFFFLRAAELTGQGCAIGLLATNTISQGDTREVALDRLHRTGWTTYRAWKSRPWPGEASLEIAQVWLWGGAWKIVSILDGHAVRGISPSLDPEGRATGTPTRLAATEGASYIGSYVYGEGFLLPPEKAQDLISSDARNSDVLRPYLTGEDLNSQPDLTPSRWVIDFDNMSEAQAQTYSGCWELVRERVRPYRLGQDAQKYPTMVSEWWKFWRPRRELYDAISRLNRVVGIARVSNTVMPTFIPTGMVYSDQVVIFSYDDDAHLGVLSSGFHWWWVVTHGSKRVGGAPRYTPTDCFQTFPQPTLTASIERLSRALYQHRQEVMLGRRLGLTKIYNLVSNQREHSEDVQRLRQLHGELDQAIAEGYGWSDLNLTHGFYETRHGVRHTFASSARAEILDRLLELNHERYRKEVAAGLHVKKSGARRRKPKAVGQPTLEGTT